MNCQVCSKSIRKPKTGRPPNYCGIKCKEKARRNRDKDRETVSRKAVGYLPDVNDPGPTLETAEVMCRVCGEHPALYGPKGNPILCEGCGNAGRG